MKTLVIDLTYHVILDGTTYSETMGEIPKSATIVRVQNLEDESEGTWYCEYHGITHGMDLLKDGSLYLSDDLEEAKNILNSRLKTRSKDNGKK